MTALEKYQRLEAAALWRATPDSQRRDVIVSIGEATLVITDLQDRPLAHWSIGALARANPEGLPALYYPDGDPGETLELTGEEAEMIQALEKLRRSVDRRRPQKGRVRIWSVSGVIALLAAVLLLWVPQALERHALSLLPQAKRDEIGAKLFTEVQELTGPPCGGAPGRAALGRMARKIAPDAVPQVRIQVLPSGLKQTAHLPGGLIVISQELIASTRDPEALAGFIAAERLRAEDRDPMQQLLDNTGTLTVLRLLTTGEIPQGALRREAGRLILAAPDPLPPVTVLSGFERMGLQTRAYALAVDPSGESTLPLIEGDPFPGGTEDPFLSDGDWLRLQGICQG